MRDEGLKQKLARLCRAFVEGSELVDLIWIILNEGC